MRTRSLIASLVPLIGIGCAASAQVFIDTVGNGNAVGRAAWIAAQGGASVVNATVPFGGSGFNFAGLSSATVSSNDAGSFYLGAAGSLLPANAQNSYFDSGDANDYVGSGQWNNPQNPNLQVLAFGNGTYTSKSLTITFDPGVRSFGFNYEDIGDVGSTLDIVWSDGSIQTVQLGVTGPNVAFNDARHDGFFGVIQSGSNTLMSMRFNQTTAANDGFALYGFSASSVPLPPAAYAGLAGLGAAFLITRRRKLAAR